MSSIRPSTIVLILLERDMVRLRRAGRPDTPPSLIDTTPEAAPLEGDAGVVPPRPAQVHATVLDVGVLGGRDDRVRDDIPADVGVAAPPRGSQPPVAVAGDGGVGDPGARVLAEDEVRHALDVAVGVDLVADLGQQRILGPVQANAVVPLASVVGREGDGLGALAPGVADVYVVYRRVRGLIDQGGGVLVVCGHEEGRIVLQRDGVFDIAGVVGRLAVDGDLGSLGREVHLLRVSAVVDEYAGGDDRRVGD